MRDFTNWLNKITNFIINTYRKIYIKFVLIKEELYDKIREINKKQ